MRVLILFVLDRDKNLQVRSQARECEACEGLSWNVKFAFIVICVVFEKRPAQWILSSAQSQLRPRKSRRTSWSPPHEKLLR
jgi:hypothetical protein